MKTEHTPSIAALSAALAKAQGAIVGALKDSANPFFKSKYADLASCWDACRAQLAANELAVIQTTEADEAGLWLVTTLAHASGEWIRSAIPIRAKDDSPQAMGSALTYARRYGLTAMIGIAQIDDDAEAAQGRQNGRPQLEAVALYGKNLDPPPADLKAVQKYVKLLTEALVVDISEENKAEGIKVIHDELNQDHELGRAVWSQLNSKDRAALNEYIRQADKARKTQHVGRKGV